MTGGLNGPAILNGAAYVYPSRTLSQLRDDLLCELGFPDPLTAVDSETKSLVLLREIIIRRLGRYYVAGANMPGVDELVDNWINEAQQTVFRLAEMDKAGVSYPALMVADGDLTEIDYVPVLAFALGLAKAHHNQSDAKAYFDSVQKYMTDRTIRRPPKMVAFCNRWLEKAQRRLYHRYKILRTEFWWKVPITQGNRIYDVPAISSGALTDVTFGDDGPDTLTRVAGSWLTDGFRVGYKIKGTGASNAGNNNTQWTIDAVTALIITLASGDAVTAEAAGASVTINTMNYVNLDFRTVSEAWIQDGTTWLPLTAGINAGHFTTTSETIPTRYEMREFLEVFPTPDKAYTAWLKGHFGLLPFTADTDNTTIDTEVILSQAMVYGKRHFRDFVAAKEVERELEDMIGDMNSGLFNGLRFIPPGAQVELAPLAYPQTTFARG